MTLDFLNPFVAETLVDWLTIVLFYGALVVAVTHRLRTANSVFIRRFGTPKDLDVDTRALAHRMLALVAEYEEVHTRGLLTAAGARSGLKDPRLVAEGVGVAAARWYFLEESGVALLYSLFKWILPLKVVVGDFSKSDNPRTIYAKVERKGLFRSGLLADGRAILSGIGPDALDEATIEVTYELLLSAATGAGIGRSERPGTRSWRALRALTEGLEAWSRTDDLPDHLADEVEAKLLEALKHDPGYPLAHYNRGAFFYREKRGAAANEEAKKHFLVARDMARQRLQLEQGLVAGRADTRLVGLASIGVARTYCQDVHRYGHLNYNQDQLQQAEQSGEAPPWMEARKAAAEAVLHLPGDPQAVYAEAFAWHCTVSDGLTEDELATRKRDIDEGRKRYESVVSARRLPGWQRRAAKYAVLHNNLGYVLMMGGEVRADEARRANERGSNRVALQKRRVAEKWWTKAEDHMRITITVSAPDVYLKAYSLANLGNLQRLRGQLDDGEGSYDSAIEEWASVRALHPSDAGPAVYVDGLAERARLFVQAGDRAADALSDHRLALSSAQSPQHRFKIARMLLIACDRAGRLAPEALESASDWLLEECEPEIEEWMQRMGVLLTPPVVEDL